MNFGQALEKVKNGEKIFRHGWNGKGMFVVYQKGVSKRNPMQYADCKSLGA